MIGRTGNWLHEKQHHLLLPIASIKSEVREQTLEVSITCDFEDLLAVLFIAWLDLSRGMLTTLGGEYDNDYCCEQLI